jgi:hypothetical protein
VKTVFCRDGARVIDDKIYSELVQAGQVVNPTDQVNGPPFFNGSVSELPGATGVRDEAVDETESNVYLLRGDTIDEILWNVQTLVKVMRSNDRMFALLWESEVAKRGKA